MLVSLITGILSKQTTFTLFLMNQTLLKINTVKMFLIGNISFLLKMQQEYC